MKNIIKKIISFLLNNNILFSYLINAKPSLVLLIKNHRSLNFHLKNQFYNCVFCLNTGYNIDRKIITNGYYDIKTLFTLKRFIKNGDVFLDIGANVGSISFAAINCTGLKGLIICFEPGPLLFNALSKTVKANNYTNFQLFNLGCSDIEGILTWNFDKENPGNAYLTKDRTGITKVKV